MNVLLATDACLDRSGIALFMLQWSKGIKAVDPESSVYVYFRDGVKSKELEEEYKAVGIKIYTGNIPRTVSFKNSKARKKVKSDIRKIILKKKIDVIHVNSGVFGYNADLLSLAKRLGVPVRVAHSHGPYGERLLDKIIHYFLALRICHIATALAGCSITAGRYLFKERGVRSSKWHFIPNTITAARFEFNEQNRIEKRREIGVGEEEVLLGAVGFLRPGKNHTFLIDLLHDMKEKGMCPKLIILGEGSERKSLQKKSEELGVDDQFILYGLTDEVPSWLSAMDYYLMPSKTEGFPISVIEAQANGLGCLLSDTITTEVDVTENVHHLPIDQGTEPWISILRSVKPISSCDRKKGVSNVRQAGLDETDTQRYIRELYKYQV